MVLRASRPTGIDRLTTWLGRQGARLPISATQWTLFSLVVAGGGLIILVRGHLIAGFALFAVAGFLDALDGSVARARGTESALGAYLDGVVDRFVEGALLIGLMAFGYPDWVLPGWLWLVLVLFFGTSMTTFVRAYADHRNVVTDPQSLEAIGGIFERPERLLAIYGSMLLWLVEPRFATFAIVIASVLSVLTVLQRIRAVVRLSEM